MTHRLPAKTRRLITISTAVILLALGTIYIIYSATHARVMDISYLRSREQVENGVKITATPIYLDQAGKIRIQLTFISAEAPEAVDINPKEICLLEIDNDIPKTAENWNEINKSSTQQSGVIEFTEIPKGAKLIELHVFGFLTDTFKWELQPNGNEKTDVAP